MRELGFCGFGGSYFSLFDDYLFMVFVAILAIIRKKLS